MTMAEKIIFNGLIFTCTVVQFPRQSITVTCTNVPNYYRGVWGNWSLVPTNATKYQEDITGNKTPQSGDYVVVANASDYNSQFSGAWIFTYSGEWNDKQKSGWSPTTQISSETLTDAQMQSIAQEVATKYIDPNGTYKSDFQTIVGASITAQIEATDSEWTHGELMYKNGMVRGNVVVYATLPKLTGTPSLYGTIDFDDVWKTSILSQYGNSTTIKTLAEGFSLLMDPNPDMKVFFDNIYNPATCEGIGTRIWSTIVAMANQNGIDVAQGEFFGYNTAKVQGAKSTFFPFNQAPFIFDIPGSKRFIFTDASLRTLIMAKGLVNITCATLPTLKTFMREILGSNQFSVDNLHSTAGSGGYAYIQVTPDMGDNPKKLGLYEQSSGNYVLTNDSIALSNKVYFEKKYVAVTPTIGDNPQAKGWYEIHNQGYVLTSDTNVVEGKTYYTVSYVVYTPNYPENPMSNGWYAYQYNLTEDTTVMENKTYYTRNITVKTPVAGDNPYYYDWYEKVDGEYVPTNDKTVDSSKTYYSIGYIAVQFPSGNPHAKGWYDREDYVATTDTIPKAKVYFKRVYAEMTVKFIVSGSRPVTLQLFKLYAPVVVSAGVKIIYQATSASVFGFDGSDIGQNFDNGSFYDEATAGWYFGEL